MYSPHKHSYLQARSSGVPPRIINRAVHAANSKIPIDEFDHDEPFNRLTSEQPCLPQEFVDVTRRPQAFGRLAMPKLRRELHDEDRLVVSQAINSIADLVHDPERGYEAIKLRIPDRLADLLKDDDPAVRERVCMVYTTIAGLGDGKDAITKRDEIMDNLMALLEDEEDAVRIKASACIEMVARTWMNADDLVDHGFIPKILELLPNAQDEIKVILLQTLSSLMYCHGKDDALALGAFEILTDLLDSEVDQIVEAACDCMMILTSTKKGKRKVFKTNAIYKLTKLVHHPMPEIYAAAASAIMFASIKTRSKIKLSRVKHLPDRLVDLCKDWANPKAQLYGMKALTNICEHPKIKKYVYEKYLEELQEANICEHPQLKHAKDILIDIVTRIPSLY